MARSNSLVNKHRNKHSSIPSSCQVDGRVCQQSRAVVTLTLAVGNGIRLSRFFLALRQVSGTMMPLSIVFSTLTCRHFPYLLGFPMSSCSCCCCFLLLLQISLELLVREKAHQHQITFHFPLHLHVEALAQYLKMNDETMRNELSSIQTQMNQTTNEVSNWFVTNGLLE